MSEVYEPPMGPRYSQLYIQRGVPEADSQRMRTRISSYFYEHLNVLEIDFKRPIAQRIGITVPFTAGIGHDFAKFFRSCEIRDLLDAITVIYSTLLKHKKRTYGSTLPVVGATGWRVFVGHVFVEENVPYRLDDHCVVHPHVDREFERGRISLLRGLETDRFAAVRDEVEKAYDALEDDPPNTKNAVRGIFEALEIYVKLITDGEKVDKLDRNAIKNHVAPLVAKKLSNDSVAAEAAQGLLEALIGWIKPAHMYRHGQKVETPAPPPLELAVAFVSSGSSFLRWLLDTLED